ncbi:enoyl-CoA hydratase-related protein [Cytophagaceae bacterium ABcell3]|nr:enoyl-CoA hydratase-related protein [Cytophagaceae bacterium ABcell3]
MQPVIYEKVDRLAYLTLNRPEKRNALNHETIKVLKDILRQVNEDKDIKVVILKGSGDAFCAGADLEYLQQLQSFSFEDNLNDSKHLTELFELIYFLNKPVIAQVNGHAIAGGCGLVTVCDFAFAAPEANFGYTEVRIGFVPAIVSYFLLKKAGEQKAKDLLISGRIIDAEEALNYGILNKVVEEDKLDDYVKNFADTLCTQNSGQSMEITKHLIAAIQSMDVKTAMNYASEQNAMARSSEECKRGVAAFLNKEKLKW